MADQSQQPTHGTPLDNLYPLAGNRQLLEALPSAVVLVDAKLPDRPIVYVNPAFEHDTGYSRAEVMGRNARFLQRDDRDQPDLAIIRRALDNNESCTAVLRNYRKDGSLFWNELHISPVRNQHGSVTHFVGIQKDITRRKQFEDALRESHQRYDELVKNIPALVYRCRVTPEGVFSFDYLSPRCKDFTGYEAEDGMRDGSLLHGNFSSEENARHWDLMRKSMETLEPYQFEGQITLNGEQRWIRLESRPRRLGNGDVIWDGIHRDITEHKLLLQREFEIALEKERAGLLAKFIRGISHEFRTPLSVISTSAYLAGQIDQRENRLAKVEQIQQQVQNISKLVDILLKMVRLESSSGLECSAFDLREVIESLCQKMIAAKGGGPVLHHEVQVNLPTVTGDRDYLTDAFEAILDNAYKFTPLDGSITVRAFATEQQVIIEIKDSGIGIAEADFLNIFETFWQKDETHATPGFGLGLSVARKIIQLHHGDIIVESRVGVGSTFRVVLPLDSTA